MVTNRLAKLMSTYGFESLAELIERSRSDPDGKLNTEMLDALTTNETLWFRDTHPFVNLVRKILPELQERTADIRIWSAACSTGQEPYSIAMAIEWYLNKNPNYSPNYQIQATDISPTVIDQCKEAIYDEYALTRGLSEKIKQQYFQPETDGMFSVNAQIQRHVRFSVLNLIQPFDRLGTFDVVFCRNVLIYFPREVKVEILHRIHTSLAPGGYLFVGASEGLFDLADKFEMIPCDLGIVYRKL